MIIRSPSLGDLTEYWITPEKEIKPDLIEAIPKRDSIVLDLNGEPLKVVIPRRRIGFDLRKVKS